MDLRHTSVIIAIDDAESSGRALDYGLELAEALHVPVRLLHVISHAEDHSGGVRRVDLNEIDRAADGRPEEALGGALLDRALERAGARKVDIEAALLGGDPAETLLRFVAECDKPILVVGRRGQGRLSELLLGSVSDKIIRHAECPVMVVS